MNKKRICSFILALLVAVSAVGCKGNKNDENVQTKDTPTVSEVVTEEPDIGEHKDYDKEKERCYYSNEILFTEQDGKKRAMELFDSGEGLASFYSTEINTMKDRLGKKINVYSMIVPTACELYCPSNMRKHITSQENVMKVIGDMLVNVQEINVLPTLINHNAENIYFRTDNRWTGLGAYYAGKAFAKAAGVDYADISEYNQKVISDKYIGNLSIYVDDVGQKDLEDNPDTFIYYEPKCKFKTHYYDEEFEYLTEGNFFEEVPDNLYESYYKGGYYCLKLSTNVNTDRKLVIVKDDFGTVLAPFFTSSFKEIYVVDVDYLEANLVEMIEEFCITDVLYVMNTFSVTGQRVYNLETLRSQASHGTLEDDAPSEIEEEITSSNAKNDSETDSDTELDSDLEYVYDVGMNNPIGVIINSRVVDINDYYNNIDLYTSNSEENDNNDDNEYYDNEEDYIQGVEAYIDEDGGED